MQVSITGSDMVIHVHVHYSQTCRMWPSKGIFK